MLVDVRLLSKAVKSICGLGTRAVQLAKNWTAPRHGKSHPK
jgi:hypothetical protein